jgi:predicted MFS family arabinose efflux permease
MTCSTTLSSHPSPTTRADAEASRVAPPPFALLAAGAGLSVATLYYNQPILGLIGRDLGAPPSSLGLVPTLTQLGYAAGILLFAPLGDRYDRRRVILTKLGGLSVALLTAAAAPSLWALAAASLAIGLLATAAQDFVPAAASLAPDGSRGKTVGGDMTGLLLGILLSRTVSGAVAAQAGWRVVYVVAAVAVGGLACVAALRLPRMSPRATESYGSLLVSMARLARLAPLRRAILAQAFLAIAFSGFWSTLALALAAPPYGMGSGAAGAFGLAGAAGAAAAPLAGAVADRRGPDLVIRTGALVVAGAFAAMALRPGSLAVLIAATVLFDLGVQACLISHQTIVYSLDQAARSRLNALLVGSMFLGMSAGSALASRAFASFGWTGVATMGAVAAGAAFAVRVFPRLPRNHRAA